MSYKIYTSGTTWRTTLDQERSIAAQHPDWAMHKVYRDGQRDEMLRPTSRASEDTIIVASFAVLAETEIDFKKFIKLCVKRGAWISGIEENFHWKSSWPMSDAVREWKKGRMAGAGRIGAKISADRKRAKSAKGIDLIRGDWPKPSTEFSTQELLKRSGLSLNTVKSRLGSRPIAQYNYQAAQKRKERRNAKN